MFCELLSVSCPGELEMHWASPRTDGLNCGTLQWTPEIQTIIKDGDDFLRKTGCSGNHSERLRRRSISRSENRRNKVVLQIDENGVNQGLGPLRLAFAEQLLWQSL